MNSTRLRHNAGVDTIAHGLTGALVGYCGFRQEGGRTALWASIVAAEFPDTDLLFRLVSDQTYLQYHRGPTHSILLLPFWAVVVTWAFWEMAGRKNFQLLWLASAAGLASHLLLDWITSYGTMLWWPVNDARLALNLVFIVDPYVWAILGVGLWAAIRTQRARVADAALAVFGAYLLYCAAGKWIVTRNAPAHAVSYPVPLAPSRWTVVWADGDVVHWRNGEREKRFEQFRDEVLRPQAEALPVVKLFRWFAVFPLVEKLEQDDHTVLRYRDLRFRTPLPWGEVREGTFVVAKVVFDHDGHLLTAGLTREK